MDRVGRAVLVVDDDENLLEFITTVLGAAGVRSIAARTGDEAWNAVRSDTIGIAIVDIHLAGEDGIQLACAMRDDAGKVILMSGDPELERMARDVGIGRTLAKPFEVDALFELISETAPLV